jgi:DNA-binding NtrC family response regulator
MTSPLSQDWYRRPLETLVLDDDRNWRNVVSFNLEMHLGTHPLLAATGEEALRLLEERPVDVVVADLFMPKMNGFHFMKRVQKKFPRTKVILVAGDFRAFALTPQTLIDQGALAAIPKTEISSTLVDLLCHLQDMPDPVAEMNLRQLQANAS